MCRRLQACADAGDFTSFTALLRSLSPNAIDQELRSMQVHMPHAIPSICSTLPQHRRCILHCSAGAARPLRQQVLHHMLLAASVTMHKGPMSIVVACLFADSGGG